MRWDDIWSGRYMSSECNQGDVVREKSCHYLWVWVDAGWNNPNSNDDREDQGGPRSFSRYETWESSKNFYMLLLRGGGTKVKMWGAQHFKEVVRRKLIVGGELRCLIEFCGDKDVECFWIEHGAARLVDVAILCFDVEVLQDSNFRPVVLISLLFYMRCIWCWGLLLQW